MARDSNARNAPRASLEARVYLTLLHAADSLLRLAEETLKVAGLSHTQYNVLRILRGVLRGEKPGAHHDAARAGLGCGEIAERMITRDPDITRLLDRLEARGLVARERQKKDRRVVLTCITESGLQLLQELDKPVAEILRRQFQRIPANHQRQLLALLEEVRDASAQAKACAAGDSERNESKQTRIHRR